MAESRTHLSIFVASPGDVAAERNALAEVIEEWNITHGPTNKVTLELVRWETHSYPAAGDYPQSVINTQIGDKYDIFIGIMWGRFGSPTDKSTSGTKEEFDLAFERAKQSNRSVELMFYFKNQSLPPLEINTDQLKLVQEFQNELATKYKMLYGVFSDTEDFRLKVRMSLSKLVVNWIDRNKNAQSTTLASADTAPKSSPQPNPLANLMAVEEDTADLGFLDLLEEMEERLANVGVILERIGKATIDLTELIQQRTRETEEVSAQPYSPDFSKRAKKVANNTANDLELYVRRIALEIPEFDREHSAAMEMLCRLADMAVSLGVPPHTNVDDDLRPIIDYAVIVGEGIDTVLGFKQAIDSSPRMTVRFNHAKKRAVAVMSDLVNQFHNAVGQVHTAIEIIQKGVDDATGKIA